MKKEQKAASREVGVGKGKQRSSRKIESKPSRHFGTTVKVDGGPLSLVEESERKTDYRGRRFLLRGQRGGGNTGKPLEQTIGEYRFSSRPLGNRQGYEYYYQWFGRTE